ncbi:membrane anchor subunit of succinate dehydrogenase, Sdh4 [Coemansia sp. RSA 2618]|nr:membrane anchor subunit of succinate dehydrogenase, Sdh4 [Coemansia sp. RSA 2618]
MIGSSIRTVIRPTLHMQQRMGLHTTRPFLFRATQAPHLFGDEVPNPTTVPQPPANRIKGSYHWMNERAVSLISVPLLATAFVWGPHTINDMLLGIVLPVHAYMGFGGVLLDYFDHRRWPVVGRVLKYMLVAVTGLSMFGAWRINTTDVGLTAYFGRLWNANKEAKKTTAEN